VLPIKKCFRILQFYICLVFLYKTFCLLFSYAFFCLSFSFIYSRVCPQAVLYDIVKLKILRKRVAESPTTRTSGNCDETWHESGTSGWTAFRIFKSLWQTYALKTRAILANFMLCYQKCFADKIMSLKFMRFFADDQGDLFAYLCRWSGNFLSTFRIFFNIAATIRMYLVLPQFEMLQYSSLNVQPWPKFQSGDICTRNN